MPIPTTSERKTVLQIETIRLGGMIDTVKEMIDGHKFLIREMKGTVNDERRRQLARFIILDNQLRSQLESIVYNHTTGQPIPCELFHQIKEKCEKEKEEYMRDMNDRIMQLETLIGRCQQELLVFESDLKRYRKLLQDLFYFEQLDTEFLDAMREAVKDEPDLKQIMECIDKLRG
ncbi:hypothetical protein BJ508DRAFT_300939 [Ascobolus immersus RN42]|uniref:Uncharacterized protein n=1 Tax=Ascobolus immersus RN42 TaxID=1160509 RepID=A0A3N4IP48_ASCIM|nr:hypothetical protein BJ508DRAFT_300939 [Ascobolus immersus RN42]